ncbi:right-handed parallel beta-helix repeat-containing protein [Lysinibacillus agricola]|uniref:Right-handed parallel beta-helix repeat-containing protein n=1 Tax=Lysinibacillus agricola TaxID=2590012 RepID=A0ABX7AY02_9BACI|nr:MULTISPECIES: right-handed parallel beta-helix repeat-containing protein [Lysinibacillus]QQP14605.1 right-handed parallel beta-helix repeat-containing protein [Lysinibacillus agricola]
MATLVVKRSIMHRYQSIGQAIQEAEQGDFIEIREGIYEESFEITKRLTLYGVGNVTIKGGVFIRYQTHVNMRNLRFTQGQGIYVKGDLQLENCIIEQQMVQAQVTVSFGSLMMKNVDILASPINHFGLRIENGSSVILVDTTIQHHVKAQIIVKNSEIALTNCMLLEGQTNGIFAIRDVKMDIVDCEIHGHQKAQIVATSSSISMTNTLIHQGQGLGIQVFDSSKLTMDGCEIKQHKDTHLAVHQSELLVTDSIFSEGQGNGIFLGEKSGATLYDCKIHRHMKSQLLIENSKAEFYKCSITKGEATGVTIVNEADVSMAECDIQEHQQFHFVIDASGLKLNQSMLQFGQSGGIYGNDHAKITLYNTTIRELESHHIYINNARLFTENCTFEHIIGNAITCIDAIFEVANSEFKNCKESPYAIVWSDKSMGRIKHCVIDKADRTFLAMSNQSLLEMLNTDLTAVKIPAIVQEKSQLFIQGYTDETMWKSDASSKIVYLLATTSDKTKHIVSLLNQAETVNNQKLNNKLLQQIKAILQKNNINKTV